MVAIGGGVCAPDSERGDSLGHLPSVEPAVEIDHAFTAADFAPKHVIDNQKLTPHDIIYNAQLAAQEKNRLRRPARASVPARPLPQVRARREHALPPTKSRRGKGGMNRKYGAADRGFTMFPNYDNATVYSRANVATLDDCLGYCTADTAWECMFASYSPTHLGGSCQLFGLAIDDDTPVYKGGQAVLCNAADYDSTASWWTTSTKISAPNNAYREVTDVTSSTDGTKLVATASGHGRHSVWTSSDSGGNWTEIVLGCTDTLKAATSSADGQKLAAVCDTVWTSTDSGASWAETSPGSKDWADIVYSGDGATLAAAVAGGSIWTSANSGASWAESTSGNANWTAITSCQYGSKLAAVVGAEGSGSAVAGVEGGNIWTSSDSGASWTEIISANGKQNWVDITSSADGTKLAAAAAGGSIWTSVDTGTTWVKATHSKEQWTSITSSADGTILAAAAELPSSGPWFRDVYGGYVWTSVDSGGGWIRQDTPRYSWRGIAASGDGSKLAAVVDDRAGTIWTFSADADTVPRVTGGEAVDDYTSYMKVVTEYSNGCDDAEYCSGHGHNNDYDSGDGCDACVCDAGWASAINCAVPDPCDDEVLCSGHGSTNDDNMLDGCEPCSCDEDWVTGEVPWFSDLPPATGAIANSDNAAGEDGGLDFEVCPFQATDENIAAHCKNENVVKNFNPEFGDVCSDSGVPSSSSPWHDKPPVYVKRFDGQCVSHSLSNPRINVYSGCHYADNQTVDHDDNPGATPKKMIAACAAACIQHRMDGLKGFEVIPSTGRCWCTDADALTCTVTSTERYDGTCANDDNGRGYERFDFVEEVRDADRNAMCSWGGTTGKGGGPADLRWCCCKDEDCFNGVGEGGWVPLGDASTTTSWTSSTDPTYFTTTSTLQPDDGVRYDHYKILQGDGVTCESEGYVTILDVDECQVAGATLSGKSNKRFRSDQPEGGYYVSDSSRTRGCTFGRGDVNNDLQHFPNAQGDCGTANFHCVCGVLALSISPKGPKAPSQDEADFEECAFEPIPAEIESHCVGEMLISGQAEDDRSHRMCGANSNQTAWEVRDTVSRHAVCSWKSRHDMESVRWCCCKGLSCAVTTSTSTTTAFQFDENLLGEWGMDNAQAAAAAAILGESGHAAGPSCYKYIEPPPATAPAPGPISEDENDAESGGEAAPDGTTSSAMRLAPVFTVTVISAAVTVSNWF